MFTEAWHFWTDAVDPVHRRVKKWALIVAFVLLLFGASEIPVLGGAFTRWGMIVLGLLYVFFAPAIKHREFLKNERDLRARISSLEINQISETAKGQKAAAEAQAKERNITFLATYLRNIEIRIREIQDQSPIGYVQGLENEADTKSKALIDGAAHYLRLYVGESASLLFISDTGLVYHDPPPTDLNKAYGHYAERQQHAIDYLSHYARQLKERINAVS